METSKYRLDKERNILFSLQENVIAVDLNTGYVVDDFKIEENKEYIPIKSVNEVYDYLDELDEYEIRICSCCGDFMTEGYVLDNGRDYYCSDECLEQSEMSLEEWEESYDDEGDSYYTEFVM